MINHTFKIKDILGRNWGEFTVDEESISDYSGDKVLHGYLTPSSKFKEVRGIFLKHEIEMSQDGDVDNTNWKDIVNLEPCIVNCKTNEVIKVNVIFITEELLVSCDIENYEKPSKSGGVCFK